jgi:hypothetical protein
MREKRMDDDSKEAASSATKSRSISDFFSPKGLTSDSPSATSEAAVGDSLQEVTRSLFGTEDEGDSDVLLMDDDFELEAAVPTQFKATHLVVAQAVWAT